MHRPAPDFTIRFARDAADLRAAQRLRYEVFVAEMGSDGPMVDHEARLEADSFDAFFDHLILCDKSRPEGEDVVGVYRLLSMAAAERAGRFYSSDEYDLSALLSSGRRLLELGRSCVHPAYRGGMAMYHLWNGLAKYVAEHDVDILFGVASFPGTDVEALSGPLSHLYHSHLAPPELRVRAVGENARDMNLLPAEAVDRRAAMLMTPSLIKAYIKIGGYVGDGAWIDRAFNTTDVCLILDTKHMNEQQKRLYTDRRSK